MISFIYFGNDKLTRENIVFYMFMMPFLMCMVWMVYSLCISEVVDIDQYTDTERNISIQGNQSEGIEQVEIEREDESDPVMIFLDDSGIGTEEEGQKISISSQDTQALTPIISSTTVVNEYTGASYFIFMPFSEELSKVDFSANNVVKLECKREASRGHYVYITQNHESLDSKTIKLGIKSQCKLLKGKEEFAEINVPGLCIWIKDRSKIEKIMKRFIIHSVKCPDIKNGTVLFNCYGSTLVRDKESLKLLLLDCALPYAVNKYEMLLGRLFTLYPSDKELVYPIDKNKEGKFWIDSYEGQLAIYLLSLFDPFEMLSKKQFCGVNKCDLHEKIKYLLDYIKEEGIIPDDSAVKYICEFVRCNWYYIDYADFRPYYCLYEDARFTLKDLINEDFEKDEIYKCIFAIASHYNVRDNDYKEEEYVDYDTRCTEANGFIEELLKLQGFADSMCDIRIALSDRYDTAIKCGSTEYEILKVRSLLEKMFQEGIIDEESTKKEYTGKELIELTRFIINSKYNSKAGFFHYSYRLFSVQIGAVAGITLMDGHSIQMSDLRVRSNVALRDL
ncbi:MAG: hypothetical protein ACTJLM_04970 [Ehrlichia sp.]